jgi:hypothetical protein
MAVNPIINDRRDRPERRVIGASSQFPITTTQGICIRKDRRSIPERRVSNIIVKEWSIKESIFDTLFSEKVLNKRNK